MIIFWFKKVTMADFFSWSIFLYLLAGFFGFWYVYFKLVTSKYWEKKKIFHQKPVFILGTQWKAGLVEDFATTTRQWYDESKHEKLLGQWFFTTPSLSVNDLELTKNILVKDFQHFHDRPVILDQENEPLTGR